MKKKLEGAYLPDQGARNKRMIIGLSGGINSFVTAYLLKIQKYDLIGVTVLMNWENYKGSAADILSCHRDAGKLEKVKEFCHQLGIPHYTVKASEEFKEEVVENWVANRLSAAKPNPCWNCHELRMKLLYQKMVELEAQGIATGHLAKLFRQEVHHSVYVHSSNDEVYDQSGILSRLPHEILEKLMLPLSDLQQKEINKLAENFGLSTEPAKIKMHECFDSKTVLATYLPENVPPKFLKPGEVTNINKDSLGEHLGVASFQYGEPFPFPNQRTSDAYFLGHFSYGDKKVEVVREEFFQRQKIFLIQCRVCEETPWMEPMKGVLKISETEFVDCWIYPKNLMSALIEVEAPVRVLEGEILVLYKKKGKNAKVYFTGKVRFVAEEKQILEEGNERVKVDYSVDF